MIISHDHKFIFIKTNKTAGTSVEIALSRFCGPDDIITPISEEDEALRSSLGYRGSQNCEGHNGISFRNHSSAAEIQQGVGEAVWNAYYKFCIERNPWDRVISMYYWRCKSEPRPSISEFLATGPVASLKRKGYALYTHHGEVVVDKVCRYENLAAELELVRTRLGLPEPLALPSAKSQYRKDKRHYREILETSERQQIEQLFAAEIALFNYTF
jgi:hypothetical protein